MTETSKRTIEEDRELCIQKVAELIWAARESNQLFDDRYSYLVPEQRWPLEFKRYEIMALDVLNVLFRRDPLLREAYNVEGAAREVAHRLVARRADAMPQPATPLDAEPVQE